MHLFGAGDFFHKGKVSHGYYFPTIGEGGSYFVLTIEGDLANARESASGNVYHDSVWAGFACVLAGVSMGVGIEEKETLRL